MENVPLRDFPIQTSIQSEDFPAMLLMKPVAIDHHEKSHEITIVPWFSYGFPMVCTWGIQYSFLGQFQFQFITFASVGDRPSASMASVVERLEALWQFLVICWLNHCL